MSMDAELLDSLVGAVMTSAEPGTRASKVQEALDLQREFMEEGSKDELAEYGYEMALNHEQPLVRRYGLQLLTHAVTHHWNKMNEEFQEQFKTTALQLVAEGTLNLLDEARFIKVAVADLVVEIAKREWPQQWKTLVDDLLAMCEGEGVETQIELVLLVLKALPENVLLYNTGLSTTRRDDMLRGLNACAEDIFQLLHTVLEEWYYALTDGSVDEEAVATGTLLVKATVGALQSFVDWVSPVLVCKHPFAEMLVTLLHETAFRMPACDCLILLASRKVAEPRPASMDAHEEMLPELFGLLVEQLGEAMNTLSDDADADYAFHKKLCRLMNVFGMQHAEVVQASSDEHLESFVRLMLTFSNHPSPLLSSFTWPCWNALYVETELIARMQTRHMAPYVEQLLGTIQRKLLKVGDPEVDDEIDDAQVASTAEYAAVEFDGSREFQLFMANTRNVMVRTIRLVATAHMPEAMEAAYEQLRELLEGQEDMGSCTVRSPAYVYMDAAVCFVEHMLKAWPMKAFEGRGMKGFEVDDLEALFSLVLDMDERTNGDALMLSKQVQALQSFVEYLRVEQAQLDRVMDKLFDLVEFRSEDEEADGTNVNLLSAGSNAVRRRAVYALASLCKQLSQELYERLEEVMDRCSQVMGGAREADKAMLCVLPVLIGNESQTFERQEELVELVVGEVVDEFVSKDFSALVESPEALAEFLGLTENVRDEPFDEEMRVNQKRLQGMMLQLYEVFHHCKVPKGEKELWESGYMAEAGEDGKGQPFARHPFWQAMCAVLPNVCQLIRCVHMLWVPDVRKGILGDGWEDAFALLNEEQLALMGLGDVPVDTESMSMEERNVRTVSLWMHNVRDVCYGFLAQCARVGSYDFFCLPELNEWMQDRVCIHLEHWENRHLRAFIKNFLRLFIGLCPESVLTQALDEVVPYIVQHMQERLSKEWEEIVAREEDEEEQGHEEEEIVDDIVLRQLTRVYLEFLTEVMFVSGRSREEAEPTELCLLVMGADVGGVVMETLMGCMLCPDSVSCRKAAQLCNYLVRMVFEDGRDLLDAWGEMIGRDVLPTALEALGREELESEVLSELLDIVRIAYVELAELDESVTEVMLELPGVGGRELEDAHMALVEAKSEKQQRQVMRTLLEPWLGKGVVGGGTRRRKRVGNHGILDLPEKLFVVKGKDAADGRSGEEESMSGGKAGLLAMFSGGEE